MSLVATESKIPLHSLEEKSGAGLVAVSRRAEATIFAGCLLPLRATTITSSGAKGSDRASCKNIINRKYLKRNSIESGMSCKAFLLQLRHYPDGSALKFSTRTFMIHNGDYCGGRLARRPPSP